MDASAVTPPAQPDDLRARDRIETAAMRDVFRAAPPGVRDALGVASEDHGDALLIRVDALPGDRVFNRAMGLGAPEGEPAAEREALARFFGDRPHIASVLPGAPGDLRRALIAVGYAPGYPWDAFTRDAAAPAPASTALTVRSAGPDDADAVAGTILAAFDRPPALGPWVAALVGRPGWAFFVVEEDGVVVSAGGVFIEPPHAWLGLGATLPGHRGHGGQGALFAERIRAAAAAGCTLLATETGAPGPDGPGPSYRNILRAGFAPVHRRENLASPAVVRA